MNYPILILGKFTYYDMSIDLVRLNWTGILFLAQLLQALPTGDENWLQIRPKQEFVQTIGQRMKSLVFNEHKFQFNGHGDCDDEGTLEYVLKAAMMTIHKV